MTLQKRKNQLELAKQIKSLEHNLKISSNQTTSKDMQTKQNKLKDQLRKIERRKKRFTSLCYGKDIGHFVELNEISSFTQELKTKKFFSNEYNNNIWQLTSFSPGDGPTTSIQNISSVKAQSKHVLPGWFVHPPWPPVLHKARLDPKHPPSDLLQLEWTEKKSPPPCLIHCQWTIQAQMPLLEHPPILRTARIPFETIDPHLTTTPLKNFTICTTYNFSSCLLLCSLLMTGKAMAGTNWFLRTGLATVGINKLVVELQ